MLQLLLSSFPSICACVCLLYSHCIRQDKSFLAAYILSARVATDKADLSQPCLSLSAQSCLLRRCRQLSQINPVLMSDRDGCCFQILVYHVRNAAHLKQTSIKSRNTFYCYYTHCCFHAANATKICFMIRCHQHNMCQERTAIQPAYH